MLNVIKLCHYAECHYAECHGDRSINMIEIIYRQNLGIRMNLGRVLNSRCGRTPTQYPQMNIIKTA
jgi:hypothetical protein